MSKVTVIMPVKNGSRFIEKTLESLETQTYSDFEVLIWENGSDDGTLEILRKWIPSRLRGEIVFDQPLPYDLSLARLVERAQSPLLARLDADDLAMPDRLAKQVVAMEADEDLAAVGGQIVYIDENDVELEAAPAHPLDYKGVLSRMMFQNPISHPGVMLRRQSILDVGNYRERQPSEDLDLWLRLASRFRIENLPDVVVHYRIHATSVTATAKGEGDYARHIKQRITENSLETYGVSAAKYTILYEKRMRFAAPFLYLIARRIAELSGKCVVDIMNSAEFLESAHCLTSRSDYLTKLWLFWVGRDRNKNLTSQALMKMLSMLGFHSDIENVRNS